MVLTYTSQDRLRLELSTTEAPPPVDTVRDEPLPCGECPLGPANPLRTRLTVMSHLFRVGQCTVALSSRCCRRPVSCVPKLLLLKCQESQQLRAPPRSLPLNYGDSASALAGALGRDRAQEGLRVPTAPAAKVRLFFCVKSCLLDNQQHLTLKNVVV